MQVAGLRRHWIFEDLIWGLFMNKYIFPGADASCPLNWYVGQCEAVIFLSFFLSFFLLIEKK